MFSRHWIGRRPALRHRGPGRALLAVALLVVPGLQAPGARAAAAEMPRLAVGTRTTPDLCADVIRRLTGVTRPLRNVVHADYAPFVISKPQIEPLETQQYLQYADEAKTRPTMLMCKGKSADHVVAVYGAGAART